MYSDMAAARLGAGDHFEGSQEGGLGGPVLPCGPGGGHRFWGQDSQAVGSG